MSFRFRRLNQPHAGTFNQPIRLVQLYRALISAPIGRYAASRARARRTSAHRSAALAHRPSEPTARPMGPEVGGRGQPVSRDTLASPRRRAGLAQRAPPRAGWHPPARAASRLVVMLKEVAPDYSPSAHLRRRGRGGKSRIPSGFPAPSRGPAGRPRWRNLSYNGVCQVPAPRGSRSSRTVYRPGASGGHITARCDFNNGA